MEIRYELSKARLAVGYTQPSKFSAILSDKIRSANVRFFSTGFTGLIGSFCCFLPFQMKGRKRNPAFR